MRYYTGVGSRDIGDTIKDRIAMFACELRNQRYRLRSGREDGADHEFEMCAGSLADLYIPWNRFGADKPINGCPRVLIPKGGLQRDAEEMAKDIHPNWDACSEGARKLHARNCFQVLGDELDTPSDLLVCWAKPDKRSVKGGTRTAYELAKKFDIPTFNLFFDNEAEALAEYLEMDWIA